LSSISAQVVTFYYFICFIHVTKKINFVCSLIVSYKCSSLLNFQENIHTIKSNEKINKGNQVTLDDYNPINPSPSTSKHNVHLGPIQHGAPLMPFIPKPPPPPSSPN
jgi:hypothetical protein